MEAATAIEALVRARASIMGDGVELLDCDPEVADTAAFCERYGIALEDSANTIIVAARGETPSFCACVVLASTRLDVNRTVRRLLGVRTASFATAEQTVALTGMMVGGVTPLALPPALPVFIDAEVMSRQRVVVGGGSRSLKLRLPPSALVAASGATIVDGLSVGSGQVHR